MSLLSLIWSRPSQDLHIELIQAKEEGKNVAHLEESVKAIALMKDENPLKDRLSALISDEVAALLTVADFPYHEPSDLAGIRSSRPSPKPVTMPTLSDNELYDKVYGAWLGRCAGCLLGKPFEGWHRTPIVEFTSASKNYPIADYSSVNIDKSVMEKFNIGASDRTRRENITCMPEDDDTNYTVIGLNIIKEFGFDFTSDNVGQYWLHNVPIGHTCTAERIAYRNMVAGFYPPVSASRHNPYREWIGAQIRADFFGYVAPGLAEQAAEYAFRDASISHVKNGIYGEMWVAAMLAAAYTTADMNAVIEAGLGEVPAKSRFTERIKLVQKWHKDGVSAQDAIAKVHSLYNEKFQHDWCHTNSNAMIVAIALLYGDNDFTKTIGLAVEAAFDTDCNGATAGSVLGLVLGADKLPHQWIKPLNDTLETGIAGYHRVKISDMARRTVELIAQHSK